MIPVHQIFLFRQMNFYLNNVMNLSINIWNEFIVIQVEEQRSVTGRPGKFGPIL